MRFPKAVMSVSEMTKMGFTRASLRSMLDKHGSEFAWRTDGGGKWMIDTEAFDKFLQCRKNGNDKHPHIGRSMVRRRAKVSQSMASTCKDIMIV